jgi:hypothetical protein
MRGGLGVVVLLAASLLSPAAMAADLATEMFHQCMAKSQSSLPDLNHDDLSVALETYFDAGRDGMKNDRVIGSRSPAFTWAYETRLACGQALGYLDGGHVDRTSIQQCDCFYQRYISFR